MAYAAQGSNSSDLPEINFAGGSVKDLTIYVASVPGQLTLIATLMALTQVNQKYLKVKKLIEMFYSFKRV